MKQDQAQQIFRAIGRFSNVFLGHILPIQLIFYYQYFLFYDPYLGDYAPDSLTTTIGLIFLLPLFFSLVRISTVYDQPLREAFLASPVKRFQEKLAFWVRQKQFWIEAAAFAFLYLMIPIKWTSAILVHVFSLDPSAKYLFLAFYLPILFLVHFCARLSAMQIWGAIQQGKNLKDWRLDKKSMNAKFAGTEFVIGGGGFCLSILIPILPSFLPMAKEMLTVTFIIFLVLLLFGPTTFRTLRAFWRRRKFIKRLSAVCKERGYEVSTIRYPYRSLFFLYREESFHVTVNGKKFSCKLLCAKNKSNPLAIYANGNCQYARIVRLLTVELFQYDKVGYFGYESDCAKILIINPVPNRVLTFVSGKAVQLDNGDCVGAYKVFSATAFLNALERDVLER